MREKTHTKMSAEQSPKITVGDSMVDFELKQWKNSAAAGWHAFTGTVGKNAGTASRSPAASCCCTSAALIRPSDDVERKQMSNLCFVCFSKKQKNKYGRKKHSWRNFKTRNEVFLYF